jgi:hypothetical protein
MAFKISKLFKATTVEEKSPKLKVDIAGALGASSGLISSMNSPVGGLTPLSVIKPEKIALIFEYSSEWKAVVNKIVDAVKCTPYSFFSKEEADLIFTKLTIADAKKDLNDLVYLNNTYSIFPELLEAFIQDCLVFGNAYLALEKDLSFSHLKSQYVKLVVSEKNQAKSYIYEVGGDKATYAKERVFHMSRESVIDAFFGASAAVPLKEDIDAAKFVKRNYRAEFGRGKPGRILFKMTADTSDTYIDVLNQQFKNRSPETPRNFIIPYGLEPFPDTSNYTGDISADTAISLSKASIAQFYGVPLGVLDPQVNSKTLELEYVWWTQSLKPMLEIFAQGFTKTFLHNGPFATKNLFFNFNWDEVPALMFKKLEDTRIQAAEISLGLSTINEVRLAQGKPPYTGELAEFGDTPVPKMTQMIQEAQLEAQAQQQQQTTPSVTLPNKPKRDQSKTGEAQMIDTTGKKLFDIENCLNEDE